MPDARRPRTAKLAELYFETCCNEIGAVCNRVQDDQNGWDYIVEFRKIEEDVPPDLRPPHIRCFVQIKSSVGISSICYLKLSNALKFAKDLDPCFVVYVQLDGLDGRPRNAFVRHFWTSAIADVFRLGREAHTTGARLNQTKYPIKFGANDRQRANPALAIYDEIVAVGINYSEQKRALTQSLGYEKNNATGTFTLAEGITLGQFVDLNLGIIPELSVSSFSVFDNRFGVQARILNSASGLIKIDPKPISKCVIVIRKPAGPIEVSWPGHIFSPGLPGLPLEEQKLRAVSGSVEVILRRSGTATFSLKKVSEEKIDVTEAGRSLSTRALLDSDDLELEIWAGGKFLTSAKLELSEADYNQLWWDALAKAFNALINIVPPERFPADFSIDMQTIVNERGPNRFFPTTHRRQHGHNDRPARFYCGH